MSKFGTVPLPEPPAIASLDGLAPRFRAKVQQVIDRMQSLGHPTGIRESWRSDKRQQWLWGMGRRYDDGRGIVTNAATAHFSWHFYWLAVDFEALESATHTNDAALSFRRALIDSVHTAGLRSGIDWAGTLSDWDHAQWGDPMRNSPSWHAYALYLTGGFQAVWKAVGAA